MTDYKEEQIPRPEHPQPQMERDSWLNLNGTWSFCYDFGRSGIDRKLYEKEDLGQSILVPFCPESTLSGIGCTDFLPAVWYARTVELTKAQCGGRVLLHFGAVDYASRVWVNGQEAGAHRGGYTSFALDITGLVQAGKNRITVYAEDDCRTGRQPAGKQSPRYASFACCYTRTTGIWQTVWLEFVPERYLLGVRYYPDVEEGRLIIQARTRGDGCLSAQAFYQGRPCGMARARTAGGNGWLVLSLDEVHVWEPGEGRLYDLVLTFEEDRAASYFGLRSVALEGERFLLNGRPVFQRLVLDQGFYPDGIYTAPDDEALQRDIALSMAAGFNGARLHQKVFEPRFLYHCDRAGYLVWGEQANWGFDCSAKDALKNFLPEWMEAVERDFNHPAIIGWCPFNETWDYEGRPQDNDLLIQVYRMTKRVDPTRPCIDTSGNYHAGETDLYDLHDYEQDPDLFRERYRPFAEGGALTDRLSDRQTPVAGIPVLLSEYGGIKWDAEGTRGDSWGYGEGPKTQEEFIARYRGLTDALLDNPRLAGFCYTQLYDVEQETNGLYTYGRTPKFDMEIFRAINSRKAACED